MRRCVACGGRKLERGSVEHRATVGRATVDGPVAAWLCAGCGEDSVDAAALRAFELAAARELLAAWPRGEVLSFTRRSLGLRAVELAELFGVAAETVSRWERGHQEPPRTAFLAMRALVDDELAGSTASRDALERMGEAGRRPPRVRLPDAA